MLSFIQSILLTLIFSSITYAQQENQQADPNGSAGYIGIGILLVAAIVIVLWRRQRRRFNE